MIGSKKITFLRQAGIINIKKTIKNELKNTKSKTRGHFEALKEKSKKGSKGVKLKLTEKRDLEPSN